VRAYLGIDIGGTNIKAALVSEDGTLLAFLSESWSGGPAGDAVSAAAALRASLCEAHPDVEVVACGVGSAGLVDSELGVVRASPNLPEWRDVDLRRMFEEATGLRTRVENDANAAAYGEFTEGAARGARNAVVMTLGTGIGGGIIIGGRLYRGRSYAGEVGHMTVDMDGAACPCGNSGCLERLASAGAIVRTATEILETGRDSALRVGPGLTAEAVAEAASGGDPVAIEALASAGRALGAGLATLALVLDPDIIVLGGGVAAAGEPLLVPAREEFARRSYIGGAELTPVVPAALGNTAGVVGAALLARDELPAA
jgi:glucokinase